jgi:hypothetical protein
VATETDVAPEAPSSGALAPPEERVAADPEADAEAVAVPPCSERSTRQPSSATSTAHAV